MICWDEYNVIGIYVRVLTGQQQSELSPLYGRTNGEEMRLRCFMGRSVTCRIERIQRLGRSITECNQLLTPSKFCWSLLDFYLVRNT